jgi:hypothetical protein
MVRVMMATVDGSEWLNDYDTTAEALADMWDHWCEEEGPQLFYLADEQGRFLATMLRDESNPEVCITTLPSGQVHRHRCRYILDSRGRYLRTEVVELS